jgi:DNA-binding response OmpR family regulator
MRPYGPLRHRTPARRSMERKTVRRGVLERHPSYPVAVGDERILVVEDDESIGRTVSRALESNGYAVEWLTAGAGAVAVAETWPPQLILLDLGLPDLDGVELCRRLRGAGVGATIMMITARREEIDVVVGLDAGADDYVTKPFGLAELLARVRAHLRRPSADDPRRLAVAGLELDLDARRVWVCGEEVQLRTKEYDLLALLATEAGRVVTRDQIMRGVWDENWYGPTKTLDMHVSALRRKLRASDGASAPVARITTLRGVGYRLELP